MKNWMIVFVSKKQSNLDAAWKKKVVRTFPRDSLCKRIWSSSRNDEECSWTNYNIFEVWQKKRPFCVVFKECNTNIWQISKIEAQPFAATVKEQNMLSLGLTALVTRLTTVHICRTIVETNPHSRKNMQFDLECLKTFWNGTFYAI